MSRPRPVQKDPRERVLEIVCHHVPTAVYFKSSEGKYELVNPRFAAIVGRPAEEILGKTDSELSFSTAAPDLIAGDRRALASGAVVETEDRILVDGEERIFVTTRVPVRDGGKETHGLCGLAEDVTRIDRYRRMVEAMAQGRFDTEIPAGEGDPLAQLGNALAALSGSLESSFRRMQKLLEITGSAKAGLMLDEVLDRLYSQLLEIDQERVRFLGMLAHDLRNPLAVIDTYTELLLEGSAGELREEQRTFVEAMGSAAGKMRSLLEELLESRAVLQECRQTTGTVEG